METDMREQHELEWKQVSSSCRHEELLFRAGFCPTELRASFHQHYVNLYFHFAVVWPEYLQNFDHVKKTIILHKVSM
jgi:hypothetical protein